LPRETVNRRASAKRQPRQSRIIIFTGKGGVGKTCSAAATATLTADSGRRSVVISTDPAHSLGDAFSKGLGSDPTPIAPNLFGVEVDVKKEVREHWAAIQEYFAQLLQSRRCDPFTANELAYFPGIEEFLTLIKIQQYSDEFDVVVVDCAPTAGTLRILTFPGVWGNFFSKLFSINSNAVVRHIGSPLLKAITNLPLPSENAGGGFRKLFEKTSGISKLLTDASRTTVRIVLNPEKMVVRESYRNFTSLNLYEYHTDAVIVNRILPETKEPDFFETWRHTQEQYIEEVRNSFYPVPILPVHLKSHSIKNIDDIRELGKEIYGDQDAGKVLYSEKPLAYLYDDATREYIVRLRVPKAMQGSDFDVTQTGEDLVVKTGSFKRIIPLPRVFQQCEVRAADLKGDALLVRYVAA
jgi:arsenite-transporting ATPase